MLDQNRQRKCVDVPFLILTLVFSIGMLIWACIEFNPESLHNLSMPRDSRGQVCAKYKGNAFQNFVQINGPHIEDRECMDTCYDSETNYELGGLCISPLTWQILKQTGQFGEYIEPKLNSLHRYKIIIFSVAISLAVSLILFFLFELEAWLSKKGSKFLFLVSNVIVIGSVIAAGFTLYFIRELVSLGIWIGLCVLFGAFLGYVVIWKILRRDHSMQKQNVIESLHFPLTLLLSFIFGVVSLALICLAIFEYLSFTSSAQQQWQSPNLFASVPNLNYKTILVLFQSVLHIFLTSALFEYVALSLNSTKLGLFGVLKQLIKHHLGSVCKLALVRMIFSVPIFILTLIKPLEGDKLTAACHCFCGYLLNLCRKYSLPIFGYQSLVNEPIDLFTSADRLHYESHINSIEFSEGYIQKIAMIILISCASVATVMAYENTLGLQVDLLTVCMSVICSVWICNSFISGWIYRKEGTSVRALLHLNREYEL